jgi:DNA-binding transcriptional LysR family regulator
MSVAKHKNISRASEEINLTQPAITKHIKALEERYGVKIFERRNRKMILTEDGTRLLDYAKRILSLFDESQMTISNEEGPVRGTLKVAANLTLGIYVLPKLIKDYSDANPDLKIEMFLDNTAHIIRAVKRNNVNFGFIGVSLQDPLIALHHFCQDKICLVVAPSLGIEKKTLGWRELKTIPFIGWEKGSGIRDTLEQWFKEKDIKLETKLELNNTEAIKECIRYGVGFSILPFCTVQEEIQAGIFHKLSAPYFDLNQTYYVCHYKDKKFSRPEKSFLEFLFKTIETRSTFLHHEPYGSTQGISTIR